MYSSTLIQTSALEGGEGSASRPGRTLPPGRPGTHCTGGWVGLRAGLDWCGKSRPTGIRSPDRPPLRQSLYRLRYPAHRIYFFLSKFVYCLRCNVRRKLRAHVLTRRHLSLHTNSPRSLAEASSGSLLALWLCIRNPLFNVAISNQYYCFVGQRYQVQTSVWLL